MRSRVMPGSSPTMERRVPRMALNRVDLPTLGRPTITTDGSSGTLRFWQVLTIYGNNNKLNGVNMGVQERRAREKKELRGEILDAARDLFLREGYENVSMRKIAEKIEYSPTTIYLYFQDKSDLLDCICEETLGRLVRKQNALDQAVTDPVERLRRGLRSYIEFGLKHPNHYKVAFMMPDPFDDLERCPRAHAMGQRAFDHLRQIGRA